MKRTRTGRAHANKGPRQERPESPQAPTTQPPTRCAMGGRLRPSARVSVLPVQGCRPAGRVQATDVVSLVRSLRRCPFRWGQRWYCIIGDASLSRQHGHVGLGEARVHASVEVKAVSGSGRSFARMRAALRSVGRLHSWLLERQRTKLCASLRDGSAEMDPRTHDLRGYRANCSEVCPKCSEVKRAQVCSEVYRSGSYVGNSQFGHSSFGRNSSWTKCSEVCPIRPLLP